MTEVATHNDSARVRTIGAVMVVIAASLVIASALHLGGWVHGRGELYDADDAGVAEAVIAVVLGAAGSAAWRSPDRWRRAAVGALAFAIAGFLVGLSITARAGRAPDIAYHLVVLPVLVVALVMAVRAGSAGSVGSVGSVGSSGGGQPDS